MPMAEDVEPLGPECAAYPSSPSGQIYYYSYPYRVDLITTTLNSNDTVYDRRRDVLMRKLMLEEFCDRELSRGLRSYISDASYRVYLQSYSDLQIFLAFFHSSVEHVYGPLDDNHVKVLLDADYQCVVRKPYYGKYDIKVYVTTKLKGLGQGALRSMGDRMSERQAIKEYLTENLPPDKHMWRGDLYTTEEDLRALQPFIMLQFPDARLIVTKCVLKR
jgi:hypothetical protein